MPIIINKTLINTLNGQYKIKCKFCSELLEIKITDNINLSVVHEAYFVNCIAYSCSSKEIITIKLG